MNTRKFRWKNMPSNRHKLASDDSCKNASKKASPKWSSKSTDRAVPSVKTEIVCSLAVADSLCEHKGAIYYTHANEQAVYMVKNGLNSIVAGHPRQTGYAGNNGPAVHASFRCLHSLCFDSRGKLYISDWLDNRVRVVTTDGIIHTYAGNGTKGYSGDGGPAVDAILNNPNGVVVDWKDNVFIADAHNFRVRMVNQQGIISTVAGTGISGKRKGKGDGGLAVNAQLQFPTALACYQDILYILDYGCVRKLQNGIIKAVAHVTADWVKDVAVDKQGDLYVLALSQDKSANVLMKCPSNGKWTVIGIPTVIEAAWDMKRIIIDASGDLLFCCLQTQQIFRLKLGYFWSVRRVAFLVRLKSPPKQDEQVNILRDVPAEVFVMIVKAIA